MPAGAAGVRAPPPRLGADTAATRASGWFHVRSRRSRARGSVLCLSAPQQRRMGGTAIHARAVAGLHRRLAARLETGQWHPAVPYRLPRGASKKWQVDPACRPWPLWAGDGSRGRRRGVLRGHDARSGQDRVGRGRAHARPVALIGQSGAQVCLLAGGRGDPQQDGAARRRCRRARRSEPACRDHR